ncbi:MAG: sugar phosphate isomerase/epimerase [Fibrobacteria bacterium]|nr:sugar phosphate isomerase/epimerase [Fibrobacteria bacterium]
MYFTGFADEAAKGLEGQVKATRELGWRNIESRCIGGTNIHDISDAEFDRVQEVLELADIKINCFGSTIANWAKKITDAEDTSFEEAKRAIPRMQKLGTKLVRIMSYAVIEENDPDDQMEEERYRRLRELQKMFADAGITPVHENCMNYGGMSWQYTMRLIENVPGLKLVYDTGNPLLNPDRSKSKPWPRQDSWEFYQKVKEHVEYIHIKDVIWHADKNEPEYTYPGKGQGCVKQILTDAINSGYDGGLSIEPHLAVVFHDASVDSSEEKMYKSYVRYGRDLVNIVENIKKKELETA